MGRESIDYNGGVVHGMVGALLDIPSISPITKLNFSGERAQVHRAIDGGTQIIEVDLPFVAGCQEPIAEWKIPNMRGIMQARTKPLVVLDAIDIEKSSLVEGHDLPEKRSDCKMIDVNNLEELVQALKNDVKLI
jgi:electron transfer flavoprotein beta subunit